jgi:DNA polymerase-4
MLRYLFVDFNAYFASVEQHLNPALRDKPVGIVAVMTDRTCLITASYQARQYGIKTGTPVREALRRCPALRLVEARPAVYVEMHHQLMELINTCIPITQVCSIDEVLCELHGNECIPARARTIAHRIKATIKERIGPAITCSIGIAPNPFLAKTASDLEKPDGLVVLDVDDIPTRLLPLSLQDLCGIGRRMEARLRRAGIHTVEQLYAASRQQLRAIWGSIEGERFYQHLRGECTDRPPTHRRTVGHSHVLPPELRTLDGATAVLHRLMQKAAARLRRLRLLTLFLRIGCTFLPERRWSAEMRLPPTHDPFVLGAALARLWSTAPERGTPFHVWVECHDLQPAQLQLELPLDMTGARRARLIEALDAINERLGPGTIYIATAHTARSAAPMRIAFSSIPDPEHEDDTH